MAAGQSTPTIEIIEECAARDNIGRWGGVKMVLRISVPGLQTALFAIFLLAGSASAADAGLLISSGATKNVSCSGGVCTATASKAVLNTGDLQNLLASGSVKVAAGSKAANIRVDAALTWVSASALTLDANRSISIGKRVTDAGTGSLTLTTNDGGSGGTLSFEKKGTIRFWATTNVLVINGNMYTLVNSVKQLASDILASRGVGYFALANDYDASADGTYSAAAVNYPLSGTFEGLGNTISNLTINADSGSNDDGLFASSSGTIRDIGVKGGSVTGGSFVGDLVGDNEGAIENAHATGAVSGSGGGGGIGGLAGESGYGSSITHAFATGAVTGSVEANAVGGLVGVTNFATIANCHATGAVSGIGADGGLVGTNSGVITLSYATGPVSTTTAGATDLGGLVGENINIGVAQVSESFATGTVSERGGAENLGGLVGYNFGGTIADSYATGAVSGNSYIGGAVGNNDNGGTGGGTATNVYSTGAVTGSADAGGLLGSLTSGTIATSYWDTDTSGVANLSKGCGNVSNCPGVAGLTSAQLRSGLPAGFSHSVWGESSGVNGGFPYLLAVPPR
jgi:hypothetical protein